MKIALIKKDCSLSRIGGLEKVTHYLMHAFEKKGHSVTLMHGEKPSTLFKFRELEKFDQFCSSRLKEEPFDVIFSMDRTSFQTHHRAGNGVHAAYLDLRKKYESHLWGWTFSLNPLHRTLLRLEKATFEDPNLRGLIVNSHLVRRQVLDFYSTPPSKIHVIHNGVEWHEMKNNFQETFSSRPLIAQKFGLDPRLFYFLFIGHNFHRKGLALLLHALKKLPAHLLVVGHDKRSDSFQRMAQRLGMNSRVTFFGSQPTTHFYQLADALVLPSLYDPFANVTVEALAMGLSVITSNTNGGHEILTPASGITLEQPIEIGTLAAALAEALRRPKTPSRAQAIRASVQHLDFSEQMEKVCQVCF